MRNYVIINGVNSLTIKGLAINELPPIVKAPMRVLQEEIDGRDGDIITDLGYGAYDKIMTIGLYDGYDINEIIAFFNNEGTIVFSDEADKYYNFKIIEQIDYERLIKFRTASITFHCQPFKYPLTETPVEITNEYVEAEGTSITLTPTAEAPISIDLKGNTQQDSTTGKNLLNNTYRYTDQTINGITVKNNGDGSVSMTGTATENFNITFAYSFQNAQLYGVKLPAGTYTQQCGARLSLYKTNGSWGTNTYGTFTIEEDMYIVSMWVEFRSGNTYDRTQWYQVETGSTATSYEPYTNGASPNPDYPQEIHNVSGDNTIEICGKNLLDTQTFELGYINGSGVFVYDSNNALFDYFEVEQSKKYKISFDGTIVGFRYMYYDDSKTFISRSDLYTTNQTITIPSNVKYLRTYVNKDNDTITQEKVNQINMKCQELQSQLISLGDIELNKIGNYQDRPFKAVNGDDFYDSLTSEQKALLTYDKWYLHKEIGKVVLDGSESWIKSEINPEYATDRFRLNTAITPTIVNNVGLSNYFSLRSGSASDKEEIYIYNSYFYISIDRSKLETDDATGFQSWLSTHNTIVYYVLATPTNTEITDSTLLSQLEKTLYSYNGQTNISQTNNDLPFIISAKAMKQGSGTATITNSGNIYSKPTIDIEGTGIVDVYIGANQIFSVNVDEEVIIDSTNLEAYKPDGTLANRNVTGNIANLKLPTGNSTIKVDGDIDKATITNYTRYL